MTKRIPKQVLEYGLLYQRSRMSEGIMGETNNTLRISEQARKPNPAQFMLMNSITGKSMGLQDSHSVDLFYCGH